MTNPAGRGYAFQTLFFKNLECIQRRASGQTLTHPRKPRRFLNSADIITSKRAAKDHNVWTLRARDFVHHGFNALVLDLPGHGKGFGEAKTTITQYVDWLINLPDNGAIKHAAVVGHGICSLIALDLTARYPARVTQLALSGCRLPVPLSDVLLDAALNRPHDAFDMLNIWGHAPQTK